MTQLIDKFDSKRKGSPIKYLLSYRLSVSKRIQYKKRKQKYFINDMSISNYWKLIIFDLKCENTNWIWWKCCVHTLIYVLQFTHNIYNEINRIWKRLKTPKLWNQSERNANKLKSYDWFMNDCYTWNNKIIIIAFGK